MDPLDGWALAEAAERREYAERLARICRACGAQPGQACDLSVIPGFDGMHFARRQED